MRRQGLVRRCTHEGGESPGEEGTRRHNAATVALRPPHQHHFLCDFSLRALGIKAIYSGHDHDNDYLGVLQGVRQVLAITCDPMRPAISRARCHGSSKGRE